VTLYHTFKKGTSITGKKLHENKGQAHLL